LEWTVTLWSKARKSGTSGPNNSHFDITCAKIEYFGAQGNTSAALVPRAGQTAPRKGALIPYHSAE
jgi:hypothetical protein